MRRLPRTPTHLALWAGVLVAVVGVVLTVTTPQASFGWFAYAPLSDYAFVAGTRPWQLVVGPILVLVGAVVAAFAAGRLSTQRRR
jgi:heme/copper-type cytochrome/quinol oxidase subunit 1